MAHLILTYIKQVILLHYILRFLQYYTMTLESTSINGEDAGFRTRCFCLISICHTVRFDLLRSTLPAKFYVLCATPY